MIFNLKVFKRLLKRAYKSVGLAVGRDDNEYFLEGGYWVMRIRVEALAKEYKAAVIELAGDLPEQGEVFRARDKEATNYELEWNKAWKMSGLETADMKLYPTDVYVMHKGTLCRVLQEGDRNVLITAEYASVVDENALNDREDSQIVGPIIQRDTYSPVVYWKNNTCKYAAYIRDCKGKDRDLLNALLTVDMSWEEF